MGRHRAFQPPPRDRRAATCVVSVSAVMGALFAAAFVAPVEAHLPRLPLGEPSWAEDIPELSPPVLAAPNLPTPVGKTPPVADVAAVRVLLVDAPEPSTLMRGVPSSRPVVEGLRPTPGKPIPQQSPAQPPSGPPTGPPPGGGSGTPNPAPGGNPPPERPRPVRDLVEKTLVKVFKPRSASSSEPPGSSSSSSPRSRPERRSQSERSSRRSESRPSRESNSKPSSPHTTNEPEG